jgi:ATP-dependent helicase IRC3
VRLEEREYQVDAIERVLEAERTGSRRLLGVAATGLGKTVIFTSLAEKRGTRALVLAHRDELIAQAAGKVAELWPDLGVTQACMSALRSMDHPAIEAGLHINPNGIGIVKAGADDVRAHVVIASVQTLSRPNRLARLTDAIESQGSLLTPDVPPFSLLVVDEAHHAAARSYRDVLKALRAGEPDGPLLLGVTATPDRGDGVGLDDLFQSIVFNYDMLWGIRAGYLADVRGRAVKVTGLAIDSIKKSAGDYQAGDAGRALEDAGAPQAIAKAIKRHATDRRTLVFTPTVATANEVAAECVGQGLIAAWVSGETPMDDTTGLDGRPIPGRRSILRQFRDGEIQVLANCAVLTEGFDDPGIGCVVIARPTQSRALYTQMVGRGTRKHPEKDFLLVLDVVGAATEHNLVTIPSLFGLGGKLRSKARNASAGIVELADEHARSEITHGRIVAEDVELFHQVRAAGISWLPTHSKSAPRKRYVRPLPNDGPKKMPTVVLSQMEPKRDVWTAGLEWESGAQRALIRRVPMETAQGVAEDAVRKLTPHSALVTTDAEWRSHPPSRRLLAVAKKWHVTITDDMTAGQVSDEINTRAAKAAARKREKARLEAMAEAKGA